MLRFCAGISSSKFSSLQSSRASFLVVREPQHHLTSQRKRTNKNKTLFSYCNGNAISGHTTLQAMISVVAQCHMSDKGFSAVRAVKAYLMG